MSQSDSLSIFCVQIYLSCPYLTFLNFGGATRSYSDAFNAAENQSSIAATCDLPLFRTINCAYVIIPLCSSHHDVTFFE